MTSKAKTHEVYTIDSDGAETTRTYATFTGANKRYLKMVGYPISSTSGSEAVSNDGAIRAVYTNLGITPAQVEEAEAGTGTEDKGEATPATQVEEAGTGSDSLESVSEISTEATGSDPYIQVEEAAQAGTGTEGDGTAPAEGEVSMAEAMAEDAAMKAAAGDEDEDEDEDEDTKTMSNHIKPYQARYVSAKNVNGSSTKICGDELSQILLAYDAANAVALASKLLKRPDVLTKYAGLNPGQQRMNAGNLIRNAIKREELTIEDVQAAHELVAI
jgi:hypothetical protein